jgi:hypothetical protein
MIAATVARLRASSAVLDGDGVRYATNLIRACLLQNGEWKRVHSAEVVYNGRIVDETDWTVMFPDAPPLPEGGVLALGSGSRLADLSNSLFSKLSIVGCQSQQFVLETNVVYFVRQGLKLESIPQKVGS